MSGDFSKQMDDSGYRYTEHTAPATDDARRWAGWGTALKPAWEPIVVARKPLEGTVAGNVLKHGTGALNIDGCRVDGAKPATTRGAGGRHGRYGPIGAQGRVFDDGMGRWPANVLLSCQPDCDGDTHAEGCPCDSLDRQSGGGCASRFFNRLPIESDDLSPFIYTAKASRSEREEGCEELTARTPPAVEAQGHQQASGLRSPRAGAGRLAETVQNNHPTVKPESVMRHLVRLVTRPGGTVLDPFTGSGTTGVAAVLEGMNFVGCEMSEEYAEIARARLRAAVPPLFRVAL